VTWLEVVQFVAAHLTSRRIAGQPAFARPRQSRHSLRTSPRSWKLHAAQRSRHGARPSGGTPRSERCSRPRHVATSAATPAARQPTCRVLPVPRLIDRMAGSVPERPELIICERPPGPTAHDSAAPSRHSERNYDRRAGRSSDTGLPGKWSPGSGSRRDLCAPCRSAGPAMGFGEPHRNPTTQRHGGRSLQKSHGRNGTLRYTCYAC
jgi:hypothetical protein